MATADALAVVLTPVLLGGVAAEIGLRRWLGRGTPDARQTLNNLAVAAAQRAASSAVGFTPFLGYPLLAERYGLVPGLFHGPLGWVLAFVAMDLAIYVRHRAAHRVGLLWAMHAVHHQGQDYDLTVATRLSVIQEAILVGLPLAFLGVPLAVTLPVFLMHNLYQFFQHTELVGRLGWFDRVLMTPSNHRVHHACNPRYLDTNYGSCLLVWDRLFGTYEAETEPVIYGTLAGLPSYDPIENNLEPYAALARKMAAAPTIASALACLVMPPEWAPGRGRTAPPPVPADPTPQRATPPSTRSLVAAAVAVAIGLAGALIVTWNSAVWTMPERLLGMAAVWLVLAAAGTALDGRRIRRVRGLRAQVAESLETLANGSRGPVWWTARAVRHLAG